MITFARANKYFEQLNTCLIGLSIDSNPSHLAWMYDIYCKTGIVIPFPIIADRSGEIARKYGMISSDISTTATVRNVFIIDDKQIVRTILIYPMNIGRNIPEILRIVKSLQTADENNQMAPANWMPCDSMILPPPQNFNELQCRLQEMDRERNGMSWYLSFKNPKNCNMTGMQGESCHKMMEGIQLDNNQSNKSNEINSNATIATEKKETKMSESTKLNQINQVTEKKSRTIQWNNFK